MARGAANPWSGVVRGTKVVGKSHTRALRRCLDDPRRFGLNVPEGAKRGGAGLRRLLLNRGLNPFLGGALDECGVSEHRLQLQPLHQGSHFFLPSLEVTF